MINKEQLKTLEEVGLTSGEIKVYLSLLKLGQTKTGALSQEAGVSSSKVYKILDRLIKKGLAGSVLKGKVKFFSALGPNRILDYVDEKEKTLTQNKEIIKQMLPSLEKESFGEKSTAVVYEGFKAVTNLFREIIDELKKGEEYYVLGATYGEIEDLRLFFYQHHKRRTEKGIKLNMLANEDVKNNIEPTTKKNAEIKYLPKYLATKMEIVFYKKKAFIVLWTKEPTGFLIQSQEAVKSFKSYFDVLWKIAKK